MKYLAITQGVAEWLLPKVGLIDALHNELRELTSENSILKKFDFIEGPIRIAINETGELIQINSNKKTCQAHPDRFFCIIF